MFELIYTVVGATDCKVIEKSYIVTVIQSLNVLEWPTVSKLIGPLKPEQIVRYKVKLPASNTEITAYFFSCGILIIR